MNLPPTNITLSNAPPFPATNYDRLIAVCCALAFAPIITAFFPLCHRTSGEVTSPKPLMSTDG